MTDFSCSVSELLAYILHLPGVPELFLGTCPWRTSEEGRPNRVLTGSDAESTGEMGTTTTPNRNAPSPGIQAGIIGGQIDIALL